MTNLYQGMQVLLYYMDTPPFRIAVKKKKKKKNFHKTIMSLGSLKLHCKSAYCPIKGTLESSAGPDHDDDGLFFTSLSTLF